MGVYTGKHCNDSLPHGAKMPGADTKQNSKTVAPSAGNTKSTKHSNPTAPASKAVNQNYANKPMAMPKGGRTS